MTKTFVTNISWTSSFFSKTDLLLKLILIKTFGNILSLVSIYYAKHFIYVTSFYKNIRLKFQKQKFKITTFFYIP